MARPFDESLQFQHMGSSMSSQTSLSGDRAWKTSADTSYPSSLAYDVGQSMNPPRLIHNPSKKTQRPKLPKIKSSSSHGALAAARASQARLHRRGNSASAQSPTSPTYIPDYLLQTASPVVPPSAHANLYSTPEIKERKSSKVKIKPLLRKFSSQEQVSSIDLSRSAAENEGLGIYTSSEISSASESGPGRRGGAAGFHNRTTSATSQLSSTTTSSHHRYGTQYVHPMRQTPRPYTPPITGSYKTSLESEAPTLNTSIHNSIEAPYFDSHSRSASGTPYAPLPASRRPNPLHIRTGSAARLTSSSQTNLPGTPSSLRFNNGTPPSSDMVSPPAAAASVVVGRASLESVFRKRSRSNTADLDPAAQKALVDLKRQEFNEREAAKDLKYQQAEARAQEKEARRREKKEEGERRTEERRERKRARSNAAGSFSEKSSFMTAGGDVQQQGHESFPSLQQTLPVGSSSLISVPSHKNHHDDYDDDAKRGRGKGGRKRGNTTESSSAGKAGKAVQSQWALFWFRFKTVWLRWKRKMKM